MLSFSHTIHMHNLHMLYILIFGAVSFKVKSDKQGIEGGEMLYFFPPLKFSLVHDPTWVHFWSSFASLFLKFHLSDKLQAYGKQTTSQARYCCSSQNLHFKNPSEAWSAAYVLRILAFSFFFFMDKNVLRVLNLRAGCEYSQNCSTGEQQSLLQLAAWQRQ